MNTEVRLKELGLEVPRLVIKYVPTGSSWIGWGCRTFQEAFERRKFRPQGWGPSFLGALPSSLGSSMINEWWGQKWFSSRGAGPSGFTGEL